MIEEGFSTSRWMEPILYFEWFLGELGDSFTPLAEGRRVAVHVEDVVGGFSTAFR
jgi:hypothetical protein